MPLVSGFESAMNLLLRGLLGTLDSDEREVVSGDLQESHESPVASVLQVFSLIVRRQLFTWAGWRPWLALTIVAIPLSVVLSQTAKHFAGWSAVSCWMLVNNADVTLLKSSGFWYGARETSWAVGKFALVLFCCSWLCGQLIARLSRNARLSMPVVIVLPSLSVSIVGVLFHKQSYFPNGAAFANPFYRDWFPLIVYAITVLVPFLLGLVQKPSAQEGSAS